MKILITENRRDRLAKQVLTDEFSNMYIDVNYTTDSIGEHKRITYRNGDGVIMMYGDRSKSLYVTNDITQRLTMFSYTPQQVKQVVGEWFQEMFDLPVKTIHHVSKNILQ
jgi:hypothetical protein